MQTPAAGPSEPRIGTWRCPPSRARSGSGTGLASLLGRWKSGRLADSAKAAYRWASLDLVRVLLDEAIADCRVENLESAAERDEGGGCESCEGIGTELPSGGSGQGVRLCGREAAGNLGPVNVIELG